jgi:hypothetical protein
MYTYKYSKQKTYLHSTLDELQLLHELINADMVSRIAGIGVVFPALHFGRGIPRRYYASRVNVLNARDHLRAVSVYCLHALFKAICLVLLSLHGISSLLHIFLELLELRIAYE